MQVLVIGYGSIGSRHSRLLAERGHQVVCVTKNLECPFPTVASVQEGLNEYQFELVIISNPTEKHVSALESLIDAGYANRVLVEKPLFEKDHDVQGVNVDNTYVAYVLRFHPLLRRAHELLRGKEVYSAQFYVGQYLPDWRPGTDYRACYSAYKEQGGGVLRDLSHELDLVQWMLGAWHKVTAIGGHFSPLEISSDDVFSLLMKTEKCPAVTVELDYLNLTVRRGFNINAEGLSLQGDLVAGTLVHNGVVMEFPTVRDTIFIAQIEALTGEGDPHLCSYEQGASVMKLIDAAEIAAKDCIWVDA